MAETFTWKVERQVTPKIDYRTVEAQFGDGYKQTSADGINNKDEEYSIKVHGKKADMKAVMDFFDRHGGHKSFFWTPPLGNLSLFTCKDPVPEEVSANLYTVTGTFVKSFSAT